MPKEIYAKLEEEAKKKGLTGEAKDAYIYGTMQKIEGNNPGNSEVYTGKQNNTSVDEELLKEVGGEEAVKELPKEGIKGSDITQALKDVKDFFAEPIEPPEGYNFQRGLGALGAVGRPSGAAGSALLKISKAKNLVKSPGAQGLVETVAQYGKNVSANALPALKKYIASGEINPAVGKILEKIMTGVTKIK